MVEHAQLTLYEQHQRGGRYIQQDTLCSAHTHSALIVPLANLIVTVQNVGK